MKLDVETIQARWMGASFENDPDLRVPTRPRLIPELVRVPIGDDGVLFYGAERVQVLRGRSARALFERLLPLIVGTRTTEEIATDARLAVGKVRDTLSLLCSRGLLEEGGAGRDGIEESPQHDDVLAVLGRYVDVSGANANRYEAFARLAAATVCIEGRADVAQTIGDALRASGVGRVWTGGDAPPCDLRIVVSSGEAPPAAGERSPAKLTLLVKLGAREAHVGPFLADGMTSCESCVERVHPAPEGAPDATWADLVLGLASLKAVGALSRIASTSINRSFRVLTLDAEGELLSASRLSVGVPGCRACGLAGEHWEHDDPRLLPWVLHASTSHPPREYRSPKDHQMHYLASNVKLARDKAKSILRLHDIELPPPKVPEGPLPWLEDERAPSSSRSARAVTVDALSTLLARTGGLVDDDRSPRRVAPTGGNLGSVSLWVIARRVEGLAAGVFRYNPDSHRLERVADVNDEALRRALGDAELPDVVVVGTGAVAKCAQKYRSFAYRLIFLDSGVALTYAHFLASTLGLRGIEYDEPDGHAVADVLRIPLKWEHPAFTFAFGLAPERSAFVRRRISSPAETEPLPRIAPADYSMEIVPRLLAISFRTPPAGGAGEASPPRPDRERMAPPGRSLDEVLLARRAVRQYATSPVDARLLRELVSVASERLAQRGRAGAAPCHVRPLLAVARGDASIEAGLYEVDPATGDLRKRGSFDEERMEACATQSSLGSATAAIVMIADLGAALRGRGVRGYWEAAQYAGSGVAAAWLAATSRGLVGSAAGGVIAEGLGRTSGLHAFHEAPLLGFFFGHRAGAGATLAG